MEKDNFKNFIQDNKEAFDQIEVSDNVWKGIDQDLAKKRTLFQSGVFLRIAASLFLIAGAAWITIQITTTQVGQVAETENNIEEAQMDFAFVGMSDELEEVELYYVNEVKLRQSQLANFEVDEELMAEVELLNVEFEQLREEMKNSADPMKVVEALISNYQLRLEILQSILDQIEREKEREMQNERNDESYV